MFPIVRALITKILQRYEGLKFGEVVVPMIEKNLFVYHHPNTHFFISNPNFCVRPGVAKDFPNPGKKLLVVLKQKCLATSNFLVFILIIMPKIPKIRYLNSKCLLYTF